MKNQYKCAEESVQVLREISTKIARKNAIFSASQLAFFSWLKENVLLSYRAKVFATAAITGSKFWFSLGVRFF